MGVRPGYKQTEVGVIPNDWAVTPLNRISPRQSVGLVINPSTYFDNAGTVPLLVGSNVTENAIDSTTANRITNASNDLLPASRLAAGDLVTVRVGDPGVTAVVPHELDGCNCASMMIVRQHPSFDSHWLCYVMNSRHGRRQVEHVQYGTAQKQFNISDAVDFLYPVPPLPEQRAIAEALRDADELLGGLDRLIAKKRNLKQAAMQQLLTGQTRLPGFLAKWEVKRLGEIAHIKTGSRNNEDKVADGQYPFYVRSEVVERINSYSHDCEAILVPGEGRIGSIFHYINGRFDVHQRVYAITQFKPDVSARFVHAYLAMHFGAWAMQNTVKATVDSLRLPTFTSFEMLVPPTKAEQTAIAAVLSDMDAELAALEARRDKTRALKQAMMQELLTGKTRLVPRDATRTEVTA
jgi:type I restriction enzyme, S subunit